MRALFVCIPALSGQLQAEFMFKIKTASRLALFITMIVAGNLWLAMAFRFAPNPAESEFQSRLKEAQSLACSGAAFAESGRLADFERLLENICQHNPTLISAGLSRPTGGYRIEVGEHSKNWIATDGQADQISVAIQANNQDWGNLQLKYGPLLQASGPFGWILSYPTNYILFVSCTTCLLAWVMFSRVFRYLDPSKVVPGRVRSALDTLAEGLVLLDPAETIVHVNESFGRMLGVEPNSLIGEKLEKMAWKKPESMEDTELPWTTALQNRKELNGQVLQLEIGGEIRQYLVNANPIIADQGKSCRGVLISFDDVTQLERKKQDLAESFLSLRNSRDEIRRQNEKLKFLASRDPLTRCFNRRSFWELFESDWQTTAVQQLNVLMVDIDHFKAINDNHGHSTGDDVLRQTGAMLMHLIGSRGLVCRYGGEEFAVLLPGIELQGANDVADAIHTAFEDCQLGGLEVTASIGLSNRMFGAMDAQHLLDQADQCLYAAKRNGRNQVVRFDNLKQLEQKNASKPEDSGQSFERIPYLTVSALFNIVSKRDSGTAGYCQELADKCVVAGQAILSRQQLYWLEVAALLHKSGTIVSSPDTRSRNRDGEKPAAGEVFKRCIPASEFLFGILGDCEPVRVMSLVESGRVDHDVSAEADDDQLATRQCAVVFAICSEFLRWTAVGVEPTTICDELRRQNPGSFHERIIRALESRKSDSGRNDDRADAVQPSVAATIARHHGSLNMALIERNVSRLAKTVEGIKSAIPEDDRGIFETELKTLENATNARDPDFEKLGLVIDQIFDICRRSRRQLISRMSLEETDHEFRRGTDDMNGPETVGNADVTQILP